MIPGQGGSGPLSTGFGNVVSCCGRSADWWLGNGWVSTNHDQPVRDEHEYVEDPDDARPDHAGFVTEMFWRTSRDIHQCKHQPEPDKRDRGKRDCCQQPG